MFGIDKNSFIGVDVGTSSIKVAEIKVINKKPMLSNYAWMKLGKSEGNVSSVSFDTDLPVYLKRIVKEAQFKSSNAYASIPAFGGLITLIEFPEMSQEDINQAIRFEAHKYIPTSLDDIVLSWDIIGRKSSGTLLRKIGINSRDAAKSEEKKIQILLVAAPRNKVEKYEKLIREAGLKLKSIEIESFSLVRSLVGNDPGNFVIVDIGSRVCNIILVEKGIIKVNRNIDAGGRDITQAIAKSMDLEEERAEKFKISGKDILAKGSHIALPTLDLIANEIKRVVEAYYKGDKDLKVDGVILSGGTAGFSGIKEYFANSLNLKIILGNPLGRMEYDTRLESKLNSIRSQFSVCIGLALKGFEEYYS